MMYTAGVIIIGAGILFNIGGCIGLIKMPDVYNRIQSVVKCVTLGTCFILLGVFLIEGLSPSGLKALLVLLFILISSPTGAHALARASYRYSVKLWKKSVRDDYKEIFRQEENPEWEKD
ncbi:MAG: monovalent cation/H(+) antiporter subunit G [Elusimicrobiota bacterium]